MIDWTSLLTTLTTTGVVVGALAWVSRALASQWLSRNIEAYRATLAGEASRELERLRHDLQIAATEQTTTFAALHAKRSEVVATLYQHLVQAEETVENYIDPRRRSTDTDAAQLYASAFDSLRELYRFFRRNRIYFSSELCEAVEKLFEALHTPAWHMAYFNVVPSEHQEAREGEHSIRKTEWSRFRGAVPPVMAEIEVEFRRLLGVSRSDLANRNAPPTRIMGLLEPERALERMTRSIPSEPVA
jgi:hypothetical protein